MTQHELDNLFSAARSQQQISSKEVATWVSAGTAAMVTVGFWAKLKLLLAKKTMILLSATGIISAATVTTMLLTAETPEPESQAVTPMTIENRKAPEEKTIELLKEDTVEPKKPTEYSEELAIALPTVTPKFIQWEAPELAMMSPIPSLQEEEEEYHFIPTMIDCDCDRKERVKGSGNVTKETRNVGDFHGIDIEGIFDVHIEQGASNSVTIETDDNLHDYIKTEVSDGHLILDSESCIEIKKKVKLNVYVTVVDLQELSIDGVGNVEATGLKAKDLVIDFEGVGNADIQVDCETLDLAYEGVGSIKLSGSAKEADLECDGVGNLKAFDFVVENLALENEGVGSVQVHATNEIDIETSGVGSVSYKGNPKTKNIDKSGIGSIREK